MKKRKWHRLDKNRGTGPEKNKRTRRRKTTVSPKRKPRLRGERKGGRMGIAVKFGVREGNKTERTRQKHPQNRGGGQPVAQNGL